MEANRRQGAAEASTTASITPLVLLCFTFDSKVNTREAISVLYQNFFHEGFP